MAGLRAFGAVAGLRAREARRAGEAPNVVEPHRGEPRDLGHTKRRPRPPSCLWQDGGDEAKPRVKELDKLLEVVG